MARVLAVTNQKGGVGKTTTVINLGACLALQGHRVLLVDIDPQANLTSGVGLRGADPLVYHLLLDETMPTVPPLLAPVDGLFLLPASRELTGAEIELVALSDREKRLRRALEPYRSAFDFILVDCPPSLGLLTLNGLVAADGVIIPLHCEYFALEGLAELVATIRRVRATYNPTLDIDGVLLTMYDERTNLGQQVTGEVREFFHDTVFETVIPRNVRLGEAPSHGLPVALYDPRSRGARAYLNLATEYVSRRGQSAPSPEPA